MEAKMNKWSEWINETRADVIHARCESILRESGFSMIDCVSHVFSPQGYTALFLLGESHFAIHTFPEEGKTYLELSSCVDGPFQRFLELWNVKAEEVAE